MSNYREPSVNGAYWDLAEAIILQAVKDYRLALRKPEKNWYKIKQIEEFFYSNWFSQLSNGLNPDELIRRIKQMPYTTTKTKQIVQPRSQFTGRAPKN